MQRSSEAARGGGRSCLVLFAVLALAAAEPVKPPWQRLLQGDDAKKAQELLRKIDELQVKGQFAEAIKAAEELLQLRQRVQGATHWQTTDARHTREALKQLAALPEAARREIVTAAKLTEEADQLEQQVQYPKAEKKQRQYLAIYRRVLGEQHALTIASLRDVAFNLFLQKRFAEAEPLNQQVLAYRRKILGEQHPRTAESLLDLAIDLDHQGKYIQAEPLFRQSLTIRRDVLGEQHFDTASSLNRLAGNLTRQGRYAEGESLYRRSLAMYLQILGEEHPYTSAGLNNLAWNLGQQGKEAEAEVLHRQSLALHRKMRAEQKSDALRIEETTILENLAVSLYGQGRFAEAEPLIRESLSIYRKFLGERHPTTITSLNNLATSRFRQRKYAEAETLSRQALALNRQVRGEDNPDTAKSYVGVANSLGEQSKYAEAEANYRKALAILRKLLGQDHLETAMISNLLGENLNAQGRYSEAENTWLRSAAAFAKARLRIAATGLERATLTSQRSPLPALAVVLARNGKPGDAWQRFEESLARGTWDDLSAQLRRPQAERAKQDELVFRLSRLDQLIARAYAVKEPIPEQIDQRQTLLTRQRQALDELAAFTRRLEDSYGPAAGEVYSRAKIQASLPADTALIGWLDLPGKAKGADSNGEHWAVLLRSSGPPVWVRLPGTGTQNAWTETDSRLPAQLRAALQSPSSDWQTPADRLRRQRLRPLAQQLKGVRRLLVLPSTALAGLPVEVVAADYTVSYAHSGTMYAYLRQQPPAGGKGLFALADPIFEAPTQADKPSPLPPGGVLLTMLLPGSNAHQAGLKVNDVLLRYGDKELSGPADFKIQPASKGSPQRVPVLVWREGKTLSRPLYLRPGKLGAVFAQTPAPQAVAEQRRWDRWLASRGGDGVSWQRLPGTRYEATSLRRLFAKDEPAELLVDSAAGEAQLSARAKSGALGRYRYLHLATHGQVDNDFPLRSAVILSRDHPLDDNQRLQLLLDGQPIPDGRLTAEEVLRQWHLNCDLVTLSACQTALGKFERGEGFIGFAQALILAGSRSVCLSLWNVKDTATALLMERFYQNLLGKREGLKAPMNKAAALAEAKDWLRKLPRAEALKRAASLSEGVERSVRPKPPRLDAPPASAAAADADHPYAHPYYWAAFVLIGDPQ